MFLIYYDEVKYHPPEQKSYWYGGIAVHSDHAQAVEAEINDLSDSYFGSPLLSQQTEFHAKDIFQGKGNFKGHEFDKRLELLASLLNVAAREDVYRVYSKINAGRLRYGMDPQKTAFMLFVEKVEGFLRSRLAKGMLFGDYDQPLVGPSVATLSEFRKNGTFWRLGREIRSLIDTVHFAHSHHSRLIQLADVYLYSQQFCYGDNKNYARSKLDAIVRERSGLWPTTYREYPQVY